MSDTDFCGLLGWGGRALVPCAGEVPGSGEGVVGPEEVGTVEVRRRLGLAGGRPFDCEPGSGAPLCNPLLPVPVCRSISCSISRALQSQRDWDMNASQGGSTQLCNLLLAVVACTSPSSSTCTSMT